MRHIADFHIHSKYSRACSKSLDLVHLSAWANIKGIDIMATGDFTHPAWFKEIVSKLEERKPGLFALNEKAREESEELYKEYTDRAYKEPLFVLGTELSAIYTHAGKVRRVHLLVFLPSIQAVRRFNEALLARGCNLSSDGRPILGLSAKEILQIGLEVSPDFVMIPAHAWTPWFAVFGSKSGYDSLEECFEDLTPHIFAIETGLSSDPAMNWRLSTLDTITLISNSDAHSLDKLGREANIFEGEIQSYQQLFDTIKAGKAGTNDLKMTATVEFFPEEGKYYEDGHLKCEFSCKPAETKRLKGVCPVCKKNLTVGVLYRISELADREDEKGTNHIPFKSIIPLKEIISQCVGTGVKSKAVENIFQKLINSVGHEFFILLDAQEKNFSTLVPDELIEGIMRMRNNDIELTPGYDGKFGVIKVCMPLSREQKKLL
ncbi:MAG: endonuclease Q family protein [bacterium]|nr:endonuclease Q family protein [bacterium]